MLCLRIFQRSLSGLQLIVEVGTLCAGAGWQCLNLFIQIIDLRCSISNDLKLSSILLFERLALRSKPIRPVELIDFKLRLKRYHPAVFGLWNLVPIDAGNRQARDDDIVIDPEANDGTNKNQSN
jgi:hypothetical protein